MARFPSKPQHGQPVIQAFGNSINEIIDYLPSLEVAGDGKSTFVTKSSAGTVIHAKQDSNTSKNSTEAQTLSAGRYLQLITTQETASGTVPLTHPILNCTLSSGRYISIDEDGRINCTVSGGGGGGEEYYAGRFIDISSSNVINCSLSTLLELYNSPLVENSRVTFPTTSHIIDPPPVGYSDHFIQSKDIIHDGLGTTVNYHWTRSPFGDEESAMLGIIDGLQVDVTLTGGRFMDVYCYQNKGGYGTVSHDTEPPTENRVDCLLTGTYDHYPHTSGFIDIVPVEMEDGKTWGVISTNLHAGSGITIDPQTGEISCNGGGGTTEIFKAPDYTKLKVADDTGEYAGMGTTYLVPVSKGKTIRYESDGNVVIAIWAPVEGSSQNAHTVPNSTPGWSTTDDGYVRLTVMDDGSTPGACLKLFVNDTDYSGELPLHKWSKALSGDYGIAVENHGIRNMIQAGNGLMSTGLYSNQVLTGIAFDLSTQFYNDLETISGRPSNADTILSSHNGVLSWETNTAQGGGAEYTGISPIVVNNSNHTISYTGSAGGGIPWPNYAALCNNGTSISIQQDYTVGSAGGWLRVSYKGTPQQQGSEYCYSIMIDGNAIGMYTLNSALGMMGNTWILPIPPFSRFMVNFPTSKTNAYFDGSLYDSGDIQTIYATIIDYCNQAKEACDYAEDQYDESKSKADWAENDYTVYSQNDPPNIDPPRDYWNNYWEARAYTVGWVNPNDSDDYICGAVQYAAEAQSYSNMASTEAARMIGADEDVLNRANDYALSASNCATNANNWVTAASGEADRVYNWYLSACQLSGQTPHPKNYADRDE